MNCVVTRIKEIIDTSFYLEIDLDKLVIESGYTKYHFLRIFKKDIGVTPISYLNKVRLKHAVELLIRTDRTVLDIAISVGFNSLSSFYTQFKKVYNGTPKDFQRNRCSNIHEKVSNIGEELVDLSNYPNAINDFFRKVWRMKVIIKDLPQMKVAYVRKTGSYIDGNIEHWNKLVSWAYSKNLFPSNSTFIGTALDNAYTTPEDECRHDACVTLPEGFKEEPSMEYKIIEGGLYGVYIFYDDVDKIPLAYTNIINSWLPDSGFKLDLINRPFLDINRNNPNNDPEGKSRIDICIPIVS